MINSLIHHLGIGLQDPQAAEPFYDALLVEYLGMEKEQVWESVAGYKGRGTRIYLYPIKAGTPPGALQHLAFTARSKQEVDRFAAWARIKEIEIIDPPCTYAKYGDDYYAIFFKAPENLKLELVHLTEGDRAHYRKQLLNKCFDLFAHKGYGSLTMRQIAKEIGVSTGTLYHYFSGKEELFIQLIEEITEQDILRANDQISDDLETIEEKVSALGQFIVQNEKLFCRQNLLLISFLQQTELKQKEVIEAIDRSLQRYKKEIMKFLGVDDYAIAGYVSCLIDGLIYQRAFTSKSVDIKQQMELLALMLAAYLDHQ